MVVELFIFSLMDSVQSMLCCSNNVTTCFIINKHTNINTDMGKKERVTAFQKSPYSDCTCPLNPAVQEMQEGLLSQLIDPLQIKKVTPRLTSCFL